MKPVKPMKNIIYLLLLLVISCSQVKSNKTNNIQSTISNSNQNLDDNLSIYDQDTFDIAFAEWQGKSMGEKVLIRLNGSDIQIIYVGEGKHFNVKKGSILEEGILMKHESGVWIIGKQEADKYAKEIGGCSGGPSIIDFKHKKFWMC